jgi:hypothetical protein
VTPLHNWFASWMGTAERKCVLLGASQDFKITTQGFPVPKMNGKVSHKIVKPESS